LREAADGAEAANRDENTATPPRKASERTATAGKAAKSAKTPATFRSRSWDTTTGEGTGMRIYRSVAAPERDTDEIAVQKVSRAAAWISVQGRQLKGVGRSREPGRVVPDEDVFPENSLGSICGDLPSSIWAQELMMAAADQLL
jgi:hypothetical protein